MMWICLNLSIPDIHGQDTLYYFISFKDKNGTPHSFDKPEEFLSQRAIERRQKQDIAIDSTDFGVSQIYLDSIKNLNINILYTTKWLNGAIVSSNNNTLMDTLNRFGFINNVILDKGDPTSSYSSKFRNEITLKSAYSAASQTYGAAFDQIATVNGIPLHDRGFLGEGINIAVIDAGFYHVNELPAFNHLYQNGQILGTKDFVNPESDIYNEYTHGMNVLSIIGGQITNTYCGTAPDASFWLLRTEDVSSEYPIEADYWICAAEFADSAGVDIINTSLGYTVYDNTDLSLVPENLNGNSRISQAANMAVNKGMVVVVSAGNEGNKAWHYISTPSDATDVLCVGAMTADSTLASFSSVGYDALGTIKPDIVAMGVFDAIQTSDGNIGRGNGTSFAAPVITGLTACLWQSLPDLTSYEIINLIRQSGNQYQDPDYYFGYGVPDFNKAYLTGSSTDLTNDKLLIWPNPFSSEINIQLPNTNNLVTEIYLYNISGKSDYLGRYTSKNIHLKNLDRYPSGIYLLKLLSTKLETVVKLIKK